MKSFCILAIDQGTTGSRAILYDSQGRLQASAYQEFPQYFPKPGWVEHDAEEIWRSVLSVVKQTLKKTGIAPTQIAALGITNQRETTVLWNPKTGKPVHRAIVWQDRRTAADCDRLKKQGREKMVRDKTGLVLDPYFSASKISWLLKHRPPLNGLAKKGKILFGTMDTWLLWKMTGGRVHATDDTNASRTLLFNIRNLSWDKQLLRLFKVPPAMLPKPMPSGTFYGKTSGEFGFPSGIPVQAIIGDQQAALYGQGCYHPGDVKNTYGTGCFAVVNLGRRFPKKIPHGLLATVACDQAGKPAYALEGSIFIGGAVMQWLRDGLKIIHRAQDSETAIQKTRDSGGVTLIPAFAGLGSPYWNPHARGMISGITRGTSREHLIRAALESIAQQSADVIERMQDSGVRIRQLKVDGGATRNHFLMQFQADLLRVPVWVSERTEATAWGAAKLAGVVSGLWKNAAALDRKTRYQKFQPRLSASKVFELRRHWQREIARVNF